MPKKPTNAELRQALEDIAGYVLPVKIVDDQRYVPEIFAVELRAIARRALGNDK